MIMLVGILLMRNPVIRAAIAPENIAGTNLAVAKSGLSD